MGKMNFNKKKPGNIKLKRISLTLVLSTLPIFAFLLLPASSDTNLSQKQRQANSIFGAEVIDDEVRLYNKEVVPLEISEEADLDEPPRDLSPQPSKTELRDEKSSPSSSKTDDTQGNNSTGTSGAGTSKLEELTTVLNVSDADIEALVKTFSKLTGRNYIVDSAVKGKVTIHLPTPIPLSEALKVFDSVLLLRGFATVPVSDNIWKVISAKDAKQTTIPMIGSKLSTDESLVTEVIKSTYLSADEIQKLISQFVSKDGYSQAISGTNLIIVVDSTSNIVRIRNLMNEIDIPPVDQDITIIPVQHALATDISDKINQIMEGKGEKTETSPELSLPREALRRRLAASIATSTNMQDASSSTSAVRSSPSKIIPDERTNSLIVVADEMSTLKIRALVEQLDSELDKSTGRFWVYRLEHADAEELSSVLGNLISGGGGGFGGGMGSQGSSLSRNQGASGAQGGFGFGGQSGSRGGSGIGGMGGGGLAGGIGGSAGRGGSRNRSRAGRQQGGGSLSAPAGASISAPGLGGLNSNSTRVTFDDEISIAADISTNSLVINADKSDYDKLVQVVKELDVKRRQVLVEATILEVSMSEDQGLGVELQGTAATNSAGVFGQANYGGITNLLTNPAALSDLTIAAASAGTLTLPGGLTIPSQAALITAVSRHSNVNVLSAPTILSTDNQEAEIIVGENVPFVTGSGVNQVNLGNTFNQIERQDVGITLRITPKLGTGDFLSLQIFVEISSVVPGTRNDPNGPTTTIRTSDTTVAVKNRQMIATGGLIQDSVTESTRGVPFLQDIPIMGSLFKRQDDIKRRTNLLIFLTPQIIQDQYDTRDLTKARSLKMASELEFLEITPSRDEVLKSPAIDDVFEAPDNENILNNHPLTPKENTQNNSTSKLNSETQSKVFTFDVMKENTNKAAKSKPQTFAILRSVSNHGASGLGSDDNNTLGIILNYSPTTQKIFSPGSQYEKNNELFVCLGIYANEVEASQMHSEVTRWLTLSETNRNELVINGWKFHD